MNARSTGSRDSLDRRICIAVRGRRALWLKLRNRSVKRRSSAAKFPCYVSIQKQLREENVESQTELAVLDFLVESGLQSADRQMPIEPFKNRLENLVALE